MKIQEVFKLYPDNEPNHKEINYLTLVKIGNEICYSLTYYNDDCEFEPQFGKVVAFTQLDPVKIFNEIQPTYKCSVCKDTGEYFNSYPNNYGYKKCNCKSKSK